MDLRVDDEYYSNVYDYYFGQLGLVEECLEKFREQCETLFTSVDFGTYLSLALQSKCDTFYSSASEQLPSLMDDMKRVITDFLDSVEDDDILL